ncbi:OmpP1/FadL family transporter [Methylocystis sp. S23]
MQKILTRRFALAVSALLLADAAPAIAADGYFMIGYGPRQKALAGAGVADQRDSMAISMNPAGIVGLERQFQQGITIINGERGYYTGGAPAVVAPGYVESGRPWFPVPNAGYVQPIDEKSAWSVAGYANGGINTAYDWGHWHGPNGGPLGGGFAGVDLQQAFFSVSYARRFDTGIGPVTIGFAPTVAAQMFNLQGVKGFAPYASNPWQLSDMAYDWSWGGGVRAGLVWGVTDRLRFGFSGSTPMWMSRLDKYSGIIADHGRFDIPASMQAGFAYDVLPNLTVMVDWRHIFYSMQATLGNPSNPLTYRSMGIANGPGFDWTDVDAGAIGAEWRYSPTLTLRTGYHYSANPIRARSVTVNVLAPILNRHHASVGANYAFTRNSSLDFAFVYAFKNAFTGQEWIPQRPGLPFGALNPRATITPWVQAWELTLGYNYKWDAGDHSIIPAHF